MGLTGETTVTWLQNETEIYSLVDTGTMPTTFQLPREEVSTLIRYNNWCSIWYNTWYIALYNTWYNTLKITWCTLLCYSSGNKKCLSDIEYDWCFNSKLATKGECQTSCKEMGDGWDLAVIPTKRHNQEVHGNIHTFGTDIPGTDI